MGGRAPPRRRRRDVQPGGLCSGDSFCRAGCDLLGSNPHCPDQKCAVALASLAPVYSEVACVPIGTVAVGGACAWSAAADGRYHDDCDAAGVCVEGTCRAICDGRCTSGTCRLAPAGYPAGLAVCM